MGGKAVGRGKKKKQPQCQTEPNLAQDIGDVNGIDFLFGGPTDMAHVPFIHGEASLIPHDAENRGFSALADEEKERN